MKELLLAGCNALLSQLLSQLLWKVTRYINALLPSTDITTTSRILHRSALRLWFGAQTAYTESDWLKQLKRFTTGGFVLAKKTLLNCFASVSFSLISLCGQLNSGFVKHAMMMMPIVMTRCYQMSGSVCGTSTSARSVTCASTEDSFATESNIVTRERTRQTAVRTGIVSNSI